MLNNTSKEQVQEALEAHRSREGACYSDENSAYNGVENDSRTHPTVCHSKRKWARDDDGDGIREVHTNTAEGLWTELRNYLRRFKGVSKHYLDLYVAMFQWMYNLKKISPAFIQILVFSKLKT